MKYKNFLIPDNEIETIVNKLGCSMIEAAEMYLSDNGLVKDEVIEELSKKAQKNRITSTIHEAKSGKNNRKAPKRKENPLKKEIISAIYTVIANEITSSANTFVRNDEKYIDFTIAGRNFTVNLVEHRPKKK